MVKGYTPSPWLAQTFAKGWSQPQAVYSMQKLLSWRDNQDAHIQAIIFSVGGPIFDFLVPNINEDQQKGFFACIHAYIYMHTYIHSGKLNIVQQVTVHTRTTYTRSAVLYAR